MKTLKNLFLSLILTSLSFIGFGQYKDSSYTMKIWYNNTNYTEINVIYDNYDNIDNFFIFNFANIADSVSYNDIVQSQIDSMHITIGVKFIKSINTTYYWNYLNNMTLNNTNYKGYEIDNVAASWSSHNNHHIILNVPENLSVSKKEMVSNLSVYPNPVVDILTINFESTEPVNVTITDMNGSIVYSETTQFATKVDMSMLPSGMYFVKIGNETKKIFKQ